MPLQLAFNGPTRARPATLGLDGKGVAVAFVERAVRTAPYEASDPARRLLDLGLALGAAGNRQLDLFVRA